VVDGDGAEHRISGERNPKGSDPPGLADRSAFQKAPMAPHPFAYENRALKPVCVSKPMKQVGGLRCIEMTAGDPDIPRTNLNL
jgi:hypothetical protein